MKKVNKKGFTLVELLAVIVILALLMAVAVTSMGGVLTNTRRNTTRQSAGSILDTVRLELQTSYITGNIPSGVYVFTKDVLDKGGSDAPLGGKFIYYDNSTANSNVTAVPNSTRIYKIANSEGVTSIVGGDASGSETISDFTRTFSATNTISVTCTPVNDSSDETPESSQKYPSFVLIKATKNDATQVVTTKYAICLRVTGSGTTFWGEESAILSADGGGFFSDISNESGDAAVL